MHKHVRECSLPASACQTTADRRQSTLQRRTHVLKLGAAPPAHALSQSMLDHVPLTQNVIRKPQAHDASMRSLTGEICTLLVVCQGCSRSGSRSVTMCTADQFELGSVAPPGWHHTQSPSSNRAARERPSSHECGSATCSVTVRCQLHLQASGATPDFRESFAT